MAVTYEHRGEKTQLSVNGPGRTDGPRAPEPLPFLKAVPANGVGWNTLEASSVDFITQQATGAPDIIWDVSTNAYNKAVTRINKRADSTGCDHIVVPQLLVMVS